jgi:hypothetical protein
MLKPDINTLKNTTKTLPAVYVCLDILDGQSLVFNMHFEPYQNPNEYDASIQKNKLATLRAENNVSFKLLEVAYSRYLEYLSFSKC